MEAICYCYDELKDGEISGVKMTRGGRFGKYGDLKRKGQIRATRVSRSKQDKIPFTSVRVDRLERPGKGPKK
jgi:hypothetical protein